MACLPDTSIVLGVHLRELMASPTGKSLLTQPFDVGGVPVRVETLADWTGFKRDEIDHLVLGVNAEKTIPLPTLIVRLRQEVQEDDFATQRLAAHAPSTAEKALRVRDFSRRIMRAVSQHALCLPGR